MGKLFGRHPFVAAILIYLALSLGMLIVAGEDAGKGVDVGYSEGCVQGFTC